MITNGSRNEGVIVAAGNVEKIKCDTCNRELKTSVEWIRINNGMIQVTRGCCFPT